MSDSNEDLIKALAARRSAAEKAEADELAEAERVKEQTQTKRQKRAEDWSHVQAAIEKSTSALNSQLLPLELQLILEKEEEYRDFPQIWLIAFRGDLKNLTAPCHAEIEHMSDGRIRLCIRNAPAKLKIEERFIDNARDFNETTSDFLVNLLLKYAVKGG